MARKPRSFRIAGQLTAEQREREYDRQRDQARPWRKWYYTARWKAIAKMQLAAEPLCRMCHRKGRLAPATTCDHIERHGGDPIKFWGGPFQSLCTSCHSSEKQSQERR